MRGAAALFLFAAGAWAQPWAITHVTVIDVNAGRAAANMTVVVQDERIISVTPAGKTKAPQGARIIDGRRKYLIPGLWDMHVHMLSSQPPDPDSPAPREFYAPQFLANGITGVRSMFDSLPALRKLNAPRVVASGPILDGPNPYWQGSIACSNPEQGRAAVRRVKADGADFVKVYSGLDKETYLAIADEAQRAGLPFAGHVPNSVTAAEASDAGQKSLEHLTRLENNEPALYARLVKNGTWATPTLTVLRSTAYYTDPGYTKDDRIPLLPPLVRAYWKMGWGWLAKEQEAERKQRFVRRLELAGEMHRAGVRILAGTDTPNPYVFPGTSLHDELELLVKAGLSPAEALRCATLRPAEFLGRTDDLGTITKGRLADMVLLAGNPLSDIANTRRIEMVTLGGRVVSGGR